MAHSSSQGSEGKSDDHHRNLQPRRQQAPHVRLRPFGRETYARVKDAGFKWAPKQDLFVAPMWTPAREDLCIELAGEIEAEAMTLAERAEVKADRLEALAGKRRQQANAFSDAAHTISERFAVGQPILVGHHSERRARKDRDRADNAMLKAIVADKAAGYWLYKASASQHHANRKNSDGVRARRIKTLLAELRDLQRRLNHAALALDMLDKLDGDALVAKAIGIRLKTGDLFKWEAWSDVDAGRKTLAEVKAEAIAMHESALDGANIRRWVNHTLNRLSYERELMGEVERFTGTVTPVMLQEFAREHGAASPVGKALPDGRLLLASPSPLPAHIGSGLFLELTAAEWCDLMHSCGYEAKAKADAKAAKANALAPLLNIKAAEFRAKLPYHRGQIDTYRVVEMTKADYAKINSEMRGTRVSDCGGFRFRICPDMRAAGPFYSRPWVAAFFVDAKVHTMPEAAQ